MGRRTGHRAASARLGSLLVVLLAHLVAAWTSKGATPPSATPAPPGTLYQNGMVAIIPQDNRTVFYEAFDSAKSEIRIEICVLEDPDILSTWLIRPSTVQCPPVSD